jgi:integrase
MSIYPTKNRRGELAGSFRIEVQKGKKRLRGKADSLREAKLVEQQLIAELNAEDDGLARTKKGPVPKSEFVTLGQAIGRAQGKLWSGQETKARSFQKLGRIQRILGPTFPLDLFDTNAVDTVIDEITEDGASGATINRYLSAISAFMRFCISRNLKTTPAPTLDWRKESEGRLRWLSYDEEDGLMGLLPEPFASLVYVAIRTGMRASEILTLKPEQIEDRWVRLWKTKNGSTRSVPVNQELHDVLSQLVSDGMPGYFQLRDAWDRARSQMGLSDDRGFVFHSCRHTFAVRAIQANVNVRVLQKLMGHKTIQTTLRYASVDDTTLADAALSALSFHDVRGNNAGESRPKLPILHRQGSPTSLRNNARKTGMSPPSDLKSPELCSCGFESRRPHHQCPY